MAEHPAVNRRVVGSSPTSGAKYLKLFRATERVALNRSGGNLDKPDSIGLNVAPLGLRMKHANRLFAYTETKGKWENQNVS